MTLAVDVTHRLGRFTLEARFMSEGKLTAFFGPSGSGKTSLLNIIAGILRPDQGSIVLNDRVLVDTAKGIVVPMHRRRIGYVFQEARLFPHLTVRQNLEFAAGAWPRRERHRRVAEALDRFQLAQSAELPPHRAAPAVRLRAAAARAAIAEPKLLLIDDCAMDEALLAQIRASIKSPILLVTGDLDLCCTAACQLLVLEGGRIAQRGTPAEVIDQPDSVEVARLLGIPNLFQCTVAALDPGRNTSRLEFENFVLTGPYIRGHFRGDRVWVAIAADRLAVHPGDGPMAANSVSTPLLRASERSRSVRLEFAYGIVVEISHEEFARQKDNKSWQVEFPPAALRIL